MHNLDFLIISPSITIYKSIAKSLKRLQSMKCPGQKETPTHHRPEFDPHSPPLPFLARIFLRVTQTRLLVIACLKRKKENQHHLKHPELTSWKCKSSIFIIVLVILVLLLVIVVVAILGSGARGLLFLQAA